MSTLALGEGWGVRENRPESLAAGEKVALKGRAGKQGICNVCKRLHYGHTFGTGGSGCTTMQWANPLLCFAMTVVYSAATLL